MVELWTARLRQADLEMIMSGKAFSVLEMQ
jgi:hypothetical protein